MTNLAPVLAALVPATLLAAAAPARADAPDRTAGTDVMPSVSGGLEVMVATTASQTVGDLGAGMDAAELGGTTSQVGLRLGHRITPSLAIAFYVDGWPEHRSARGDVRVGSAGLAADVHLRPGAALDPWISLGSGVRAMLIDDDDGDDTLLVGAELARLQAGVDLRATPEVALALVVGATASLYGAGKHGDAEFAEVTRHGVSWTFNAGVAGRFNLFGSRH